jgi:hypothetical protein
MKPPEGFMRRNKINIALPIAEEERVEDAFFDARGRTCMMRLGQVFVSTAQTNPMTEKN